MKEQKKSRPEERPVIQKRHILDNEQIDIAVLSAIRQRAVPTGATALTEELGLPQATLGRIMNRLEKDGYLEKVSNKGRILSGRGAAYLDSMTELQDKEAAAGQLIQSAASLSPRRLVEILEIRRDLEQQSARQACLQATDEQLESLRGLMLEYLYEINSGGMGSAQDLRFHLTLALYSGNETLHQILTILLTNRHAYADFALYSESFLIRQAESHHTIIEALLRRDPDGAAAAMAAHLDNILIPLRDMRDRQEALSGFFAFPSPA